MERDENLKKGKDNSEPSKNEPKEEMISSSDGEITEHVTKNPHGSLQILNKNPSRRNTDQDVVDYARYDNPYPDKEEISCDRENRQNSFFNNSKQDGTDYPVSDNTEQGRLETPNGSNDMKNERNEFNEAISRQCEERKPGGHENQYATGDSITSDTTDNATGITTHLNEDNRSDNNTRQDEDDPDGESEDRHQQRQRFEAIGRYMLEYLFIQIDNDRDLLEIALQMLEDEPNPPMDVVSILRSLRFYSIRSWLINRRRERLLQTIADTTLEMQISRDEQDENAGSERLLQILIENFQYLAELNQVFENNLDYPNYVEDNSHFYLLHSYIFSVLIMLLILITALLVFLISTL